MVVATERPTTREDLIHEIERALWSYSPVRSRDLPIDLDVSDDGRATVHGHAPSRTIKEGVLEVVSSVSGVAEVVDEVHADPDVELAVAQALSSDDRTKHIPPGAVQIFAQLGVMVLVGRLTAEDRESVVDVAGEVDGVREVVDRMSS